MLNISGDGIMDYKMLYLHLFNAVTDAIELAQEGQTEEACKRLISAQQECEEMYVSDDDT